MLCETFRPLDGSNDAGMKPYLKSVITATLIAGLVLLFTIRVVAPNLPPMAGRPDVEEVREFTRPSAGKLRLQSTDGLISIRSHDSANVVGRAHIRAFLRSGTKDTLESYIASLVQLNETNGELLITTEAGERPDPFELFVVYDIGVPRGTDIEIESNNGNVWVNEGCGAVTVRGRNTDIRIDRPQGKVMAESVNGRVQLIEAPDGGSIRTVNGNVYAGVRGGRLDAATDNGVIRATVLDPAVVSATLTSQNGGVTLLMANQVSASIRARTSRGSVRAELPVQTSGVEPSRRYLEGTIGDGHSKIVLDALNGNIVIARSE